MDETLTVLMTPELIVASRDEAHAGRTEAMFVTKETWEAICPRLTERFERIERLQQKLQASLGIPDDVLASTSGDSE